MINATIYDSKKAINNEIAIQSTPTGDVHSLVVSTIPYTVYSNEVRYYTNSTYGKDLNQNVSFGGTPAGVYNGGDSVLWTPSTVVGNAGDFIEESTDQAHTGTKSLDATSSEGGDIIQFANGADINLNNYSAITGWIYITGWDSSNQNVYLYAWDTDASLQRGTTISLGNYVDRTSFNTWQQFAIPLESVGLGSETTVDAFRIETVDLGAGSPPNYYIDDLQIEETGASLSYTVESSIGKYTIIEKTRFFIADAYAGTVTNGTMPSIPYDSLLGVSALGIGLSYSHYNKNETFFSTQIKKLSDLLSIPGVEVINTGSDGVNTWAIIEMTYTEPIILKSDTEDILQLTVNDNLSGLLEFSASVSCKVVNI